MKNRFRILILFLLSTILMQIVACQFNGNILREVLGAHNANAMWVEPSSIALANDTAIIGYKFNITVWLNITSDNVFGWQVALLYNRTQLRGVRGRFTAGSISQFMQGHNVESSAPIIDTSSLGNGSVLSYEVCKEADYVQVPRAGSLIWIEFEVMTLPSGGGNFTSKFDITTNYPDKTWVQDPTLNKILLATYDGTYIISVRPVTSIVLLKTVVNQGYGMPIRETIANNGDFDEIFNVTVEANTTIIQNQTVPLNSGSAITQVFNWNTSGFAKGNYTIILYAVPMLHQANTSDTNFTGGWVIVSMVGDLTGGTPNSWGFVPDGTVDGSDIIVVSRCYGSYPGAAPPMKWNANCDINNDNVIDGSDLIIVSRHYGQSDP